MSGSRPTTTLAGIGFALAALIIYATLNLVVKALSEDFGAVQLVFFRQALALPVIALAFSIGGGMAAFRSQNRRLHALRGILGMLGTTGIFYGLGHLPLADAVSLALTAPIFTTALSVPILGERVGPKRWGVLLIGFLGALVIIRPGAGVFDPASVAVVGGCFLLAVHVLIGRRISREESSATITFYYAFGSSVLAACALPFAWQPVESGDLWPLALLGLLNGIGLLVLTEAFRRAQAAVLAPFDYLHLVIATAFGFFLWNEIPAWHVIGGAAIVIAAGLANLRFEVMAARPAPIPPTAL
jgi:drug/metabolite transporter (DMT)-like permease